MRGPLLQLMPELVGVAVLMMACGCEEFLGEHDVRVEGTHTPRQWHPALALR